MVERVLGNEPEVAIGGLVLGPEDARQRNLLVGMRYNRRMALKDREPWAFYNCASLLEDGGSDALGNRHNISQYYRHMANELRDPYALSDQAFSYRLGLGVAEDRDKAWELYKEAGERGHLGSLLKVANRLVESDSEAEQKKGLALLDRAAAEDADELEELASLYHNGEQVGKNMELAEKYYGLASDAGDAHAASELGRFYKGGWTGEESLEAALEFFRLSGARGGGWGSYHLGSTLLKNAETEEEAREGLFWIEHAAVRENEEAMREIYKLYYRGGQLFPKDLEKWRYWIEWAVAHEDEDSMLTYAIHSVVKGEDGRIENEDRAWNLARKVLVLGDYRALSVLGAILGDRSSTRYSAESYISLLEMYQDKAGVVPSLLGTLLGRVGNELEDPARVVAIFEDERVRDDEFAIRIVLAIYAIFPEVFDDVVSRMRERFESYYSDDAFSRTWGRALSVDSNDIADIYDALAEGMFEHVESLENLDGYTLKGRALIRAPEIVLPDWLAMTHFGFSVRTEFRLRPDGSLWDIKIVESDHDFGTVIAKENLSQWKWETVEEDAEWITLRLKLRYDPFDGVE